MTTTRNTSAAGALVALVLSLCSVASPAFVADSAARPASPTNGCTGPYGWPVKPFDRAHPVRGAFGDPRTVFDGPRSQRTIDVSGGMFQFHHGIDISAPDGSPVYAVATGRITRTRGDRVTVDCGNGRSFEYWHVTAAVRVGQHAIAGKTVLGHILPKREHVHLTLLEGGRPLNPLGAGRLTPFNDTTKPSVTAIALRRDDLGGALSTSHVTGRALLFAEASDMPALAVPGRWHGFPVTPALVSWRIETARGRVVVGNQTARDVRRLIPGTDAFWITFSRGTHQNWPVFTDGKAQFMTGRYVFRLSTTPLDTRKLADGDYELIVSVEDTAGNRADRAQSFTVDNH
jgi:murein DD-endopeptidase MepM/ murein hydrolase activator NlpD